MRQRLSLSFMNNNTYMYFDNVNKFTDKINVLFSEDDKKYINLSLPTSKSLNSIIYYLKFTSEEFQADELIKHLSVTMGEGKFVVYKDNVYFTSQNETSFSNTPYNILNTSGVSQNIFVKSDIPGTETKPIKLEKSLINCTLSPDINELENNTHYTFNLTSNEGYIFNKDDVPIFEFYNKNNVIEKINFIKVDDTNYKCDIKVEFYNNSTAKITSKAIVNPKFNISVVTDFTNYEWINEVTEIPNNSLDPIELKIQPSFTLKNPSTDIIPYATYTTPDEVVKQLNFNLIKDELRGDYYTLEIINLSFLKNSTFNITAVSYESKALFNTDNILGSTINPLLPEYYSIDTFEPGIYKITCDKDYIFNEVPKMVYTDSINRERVISSTLSKDKLVATFNLSNNIKVLNNSIIYFYATAIPKEKEFSLSSIYNPTDEQIKELNKKRFYEIGEPTPPYNPNQVDLGQYILSLKKFFINFDKYYKDTILLGSYDTNIVCEIIPNYYKTISCGIRHITGIYNNSIDYNHSVIEFNLAFVGLKQVEAYKVLNKDVEIKYIININNGDCMVQLLADNTIIETFNGICSIDIPYILTTINNGYKENVNGSINTDTIALYHVTPEVIIKENNLLDKDTVLYGTTTIKYDYIKNNIGYVKCNNTHVTNIPGTLSEIQMIENYLNSGIIINS